MSYAHFDDDHDLGRITRLSARLAAETRMQLGREISFFQDRRSLKWGNAWQRCIDDTLDIASLFIPIVTPNFVRSPFCQKELQTFLRREARLQRDDLVLPILYVECFDELEDGDEITVEVCRRLQERQYQDWRELRFESPTSAAVGRALAGMAKQLRQALRTFRRDDDEKGASDAPARAALPSHALAVGRLPIPQPRGSTLVVEPGAGSPLREALEKARAGDRLLVSPGRYAESLSWDKPIEIVGNGPATDVVLEGDADGPTIAFQGSLGRLAGVTVTQNRTPDAPAIDITRGRLILEDCDISSNYGSAVVVRNGADPRVSRCRLHDSRSGVVVIDGGRGTFEDNDISDHQLACVFIYDGGYPLVRRNRIHHGRESGIYVYNDGAGILESNEVFANDHAGIAISAGGDPIARNNRVYGSGHFAAVYVFKQGRGSFEGNDLRGNRRGAFQITDKCVPNVRLHDNIVD